MANKTSKSNKKSKGSKTAKRHRSGYILFTIDKRQQIKLENPGLSPKEIISELGALWKTSDPQTKQYYQKLSDSEKQQKSNALKNNQNTKKESPNKTKSTEQNQSMEVNSSQ